MRGLRRACEHTCRCARGSVWVGENAWEYVRSVHGFRQVVEQHDVDWGESAGVPK